MRFNHLKLPDQWQQYWTKYPEGYTLLEALINWVSQVDQLTDNVNDWNERLDEFIQTFDKDLQGKVQETLAQWQADGTLDIVISEALQTQITTVEKKIGKVYFVENYPLVVPEVNDGPRIQRAINAAVAAGGGRVKFDRKDYHYTVTPTFQSHYITLEGENGTKLKPSNCNGIEFGDITDTERYNFTSIKNIEIDMSGALTYTGIKANNADEITLSHVNVTKGKFGIYLNYSYNVTMERCLVIMQSDTALVANIADKLTVIGGQFGNGENGIQILGGKGVTLMGVSIERNNNAGLILAPSTSRGGGEYPDGVNVIGCYFERNAMLRGYAFVHIGWYEMGIPEYCHGVNFIGNYFNWDAGNPRNPIVPFYYLDKCTYVNFMGNRYINSQLISQNSDKAYINTISSTNDRAQTGRESVAAKKNQLLDSFLISIPLDVNGYGEYLFDVTDFLYTQKVVVGNILNPKDADNFAEIQYPNINQFKVIIRGGAASGICDYTGFVIGTQDI